MTKGRCVLGNGNKKQLKKYKIKMKLFNEHKNCFYCGKYMIYEKTKDGYKQKDNLVTLDHIKPQSKGGDDTLSNLVLCCRKCNLQKGDIEFGIFAFRKLIDMLNY